MNHDCNMLIDYLPETVEIEGVEYEIESNFRTFILFEMLMRIRSFRIRKKQCKD